MTAGVTVTALALGSSHSCALTSDGFRTWCWGSELGPSWAISELGYQDRPVRVAFVSGAT